MIDIVQRTGFIFRYQGDFGKTKPSFLAPFNDKVWLSFVFIIIIVILVIWCILLVENKYLTSINRTLWNFSDTILSIIGACCQMGISQLIFDIKIICIYD